MGYFPTSKICPTSHSADGQIYGNGYPFPTYGVYKCRGGQQYTFLCRSVQKPNIVTNINGILSGINTSQDSRGYLFTIQGKKPGITEIMAVLGDFKDSFTVEVTPSKSIGKLE